MPAASGSSAQSLGEQLVQAAWRGESQAVKVLLETGASPEARGGGYGNTALALVATIGKGDSVAMVRQLFAAGAKVDTPNGVGETALHLLSQRDSEASQIMMDLLFELGANVDATDEKGWSPLLYALERGSLTAAEALLEAGADPNLASPGGQTSWSVIEHAAETYDDVAARRRELENLLHRFGARRRNPKANLRRQLIGAVERGDLEGALQLLEAGADPNAAAQDSVPVLYLAIRGGHLDLAEALLRAGANPNALNLEEQRTALAVAVQRSDLASIRRLLDHGAQPTVLGRYGRPVKLPFYGIEDPEIFAVLLEAGVPASQIRMARLLFSTRAGDARALRTLLADGGGFDVSGISETPLLFVATSTNQVEIVRELLKRGADPNSQASDTSTPLMWAALGGHSQLVKVFLEAGANPSASRSYGDTALASAIQGGHPDIAEILLAAGADVNQAPENGNTPLYLAASGGYTSLVRALIEAGASLDTVNDQGRTAAWAATANGQQETAELLLGAGAHPRGLRQVQLHRTATLGERSAAARHLQAGADPNTVQDDCTPLGAAAMEGHLDLVSLLWEAGGDPDIPCYTFPPLVTAADEGRLELVRLLLAAGADVQAEGGFREGISALEAAAAAAHDDIVRVLLAADAKPFWIDDEELLSLNLDRTILHLLRPAPPPKPSHPDN
ncbi:MAG: ankyrin repeat domain-containing protein [Deltaproteobacteria bacterium]|nr:ankyrin repeat domain-containing protein [Deltaproteobacteria bacterium]